MAKKKEPLKRRSASQRRATTSKAKSKAARPRQAKTGKIDHQTLRNHILNLLSGGGAHRSFAQAFEGLPAELRGVKPQGLPFTAWRLLEHMRIALWDILEFSRNPKHVSPQWPGGYWPETDGPADEAAWENSIKKFRSDLVALVKLVANPKVDLLAPFPHGEGQTLLREALLVADHNSYHLGQFVMLRRLHGAWSEDSPSQ